MGASPRRAGVGLNRAPISVEELGPDRSGREELLDPTATIGAELQTQPLVAENACHRRR